jgi:hypothetical protein
VRSKSKIRGTVRVCVIGPDGQVKRSEPNWIRRFLGLKGRPMLSRHHNTVTRQGEGLIADLLLGTPTLIKITAATGYIQVGTGWTGNSPKTNTRCNTPTGSMEALDAGYPVTGAAFGLTNDNVLKFRAIFEAGKLNASGINEACLLNGNTAAAVSLAYAQVTPAATVTAVDTLQIDWEITFTGS